MRLYDLQKTADTGRKSVTELKNSLAAAMESWKKPGAPKIPENIQKAAEALAKQVEELYGQFVAPREALGFAGPPLTYTPPPFPQRAGRLMSAIEGYTAAPTARRARLRRCDRPVLRYPENESTRLSTTALAAGRIARVRRLARLPERLMIVLVCSFLCAALLALSMMGRSDASR